MAAMSNLQQADALSSTRSFASVSSRILIIGDFRFIGDFR